MKRDKATKATEVATAVAIDSTKAALAAAAAGVAAGAPVVLAAGLALGPTIASSVLGLAFGAKSRKVQAKVDAWFSLVAAEMEVGSPQAAADAIKEHIDEDWAHEAVIEATKRILEDIEEAALPFLARLTAHAFKIRHVPDDRDKRAAELLVNCRGVLLAGVRSFIRGCRHAWPDSAAGVEAKLFREAEGGAHAVEATSPGEGKMAVSLVASSPPAETRFSVGMVALEVLALLKRYGFAMDNPSGFYGVQAGPHVAVLRREDIDFLGRLFD